MRKHLLSAALLLTGAGSLFAQKGVDDGSKYGKGEDSIRCITNISLYVPYAKSGNYSDALPFWQIVYDECPASSRDLYLYGARIVGWQIQNEKDASKQQELLSKLMEVYDKRIKYFGKDQRYPTPYILGRKAIDYLVYNSSGDMNAPYQWLTESIDGMGDASEVAVVDYFMKLSLLKFQKDPSHREQYIADFMKVSRMFEGMTKQPRANAEAISKLKSGTELVFAQSGAADCETLQAIYAPQVEANKTNLEWLKEAIGLMRRVRCQEMDVYFAAARYAHQIEPTAESAFGLAKQAIKDKDFSTAVKYIDEAISLEQDDDTKGDFYYIGAQVLSEINNYPKARTYALKAAESKPNFGMPYVLIARMYASSARSIYPDDRILQSCVYNAVLDKLEKARSVDPSTAEVVNPLISSYRGYLPKQEDVFMHGDINKGQQFRIGGWIQETTVIR
ncbi:MAG: tetratricopeptide repeat protein [Bacteroidales bacterium]